MSYFVLNIHYFLVVQGKVGRFSILITVEKLFNIFDVSEILHFEKYFAEVKQAFKMLYAKTNTT
jgi:hypothetical protein